MSWYLYIPGLLCLFWALIHLIMASRTDSFRMVMLVALAWGICLLADAFFIDPHMEYRGTIMASLVEQLVAPCVIPFVISYLRQFQTGKKYSNSLIWLITPAVLFTASTLLYFLAGQANIAVMFGDVHRFGDSALEAYRGTPEYLYYIFSVIALRAVLSLQMLNLLVVLLYIMIKEKASPQRYLKFAFGSGRISVLEAQVYYVLALLIFFAVRLFLNKNQLQGHTPYLTIYVILSSILITMFFHTALFGAKRTFVRRDLSRSMKYNYSRESKQHAVEQMMDDLLEEAEEEALKHIRNKLGEDVPVEQWQSGELPPEESQSVSGSVFSAMAQSWDEDSLMARFQKLMTEEQLFLQPSLSLGDVAERLHSNKTYISKLVNNSYNLGFPELINMLRVDYAEQYILKHRGAKQAEIAAKCGFLSASSFNNTFKKITGMTPKVWIANNDKEAR